MASSGRKLEQKIVIVTGGGSGIGRAISVLFSSEGARVVVANRNEVAARETLDLMTAEGLAIRCDVSNPADVEAMVEQVIRDYGQIDILCNNAGIVSTTDVIDTDPDEWDNVFAVNVRGVFLCAKNVLPHMIARGGGTIVNIASVAGLVGIPKRAAYCASKGAVIALTKQIAVSYLDAGIRCNCVCPGTIDTPWIDRLLAQAADPVAERQTLVDRQPIGRLGRPEEIAQAALFLASDDTAFMNGSVLVMDGGMVAR